LGGGHGFGGELTAFSPVHPLGEGQRLNTLTAALPRFSRNAGTEPMGHDDSNFNTEY
jgi:hypothetical protein